MEMARPAPSSTSNPNPNGIIEQPVSVQTSEERCERAALYWEIHENTLPYPIFPREVIIDPHTEPERDTSVSLLDSLGSFRSGIFVRGQEVGKPAEWRLGMQYQENPETNSQALYLTLLCANLFVEGNAPVYIRGSYEFLDAEGNVKKSGGMIHSQDLVPFVTGSRTEFFVGNRSELQSQRSELVDNGIIRIRLWLNIYKNLAPTSAPTQASEGQQPPNKKRRLECASNIGELAGILGSLEGLWVNRERNGDVKIKCSGWELKAHSFILSGKSEVFANMLDNTSQMMENTTNEIAVEDISHEIMSHFLEFLYLNDSASFDWANVDNVCALIYAADKYMVTPLMMKCFQKLMNVMNIHNFAKIAKATFCYNSDKQFKNEVRHFFESHQISLNRLESFRQFAYNDFDEFYKLLFFQIE